MSSTKQKSEVEVSFGFASRESSKNEFILGEFWPEECNPTFSTAIIVPYRNRAGQMKQFLSYIHNFLRKQSIHYKIFIVEQNDEKPFNRAKLFNIGAKVSPSSLNLMTY